MSVWGLRGSECKGRGPQTGGRQGHCGWAGPRGGGRPKGGRCALAADAANLWPPLTPRKTRSVRAKARGVPSCPEQCLAESVHSVNTSRVVTESCLRHTGF